jgi:outer membrane protein assembly factor BamB
MRGKVIILCIMMLLVTFSGTVSAADNTDTCAMLIDFGDGRTYWVDVPLKKGMTGFDVFMNATEMLGFPETHNYVDPYGHQVLSIDGYSGNYNFSNPDAPYDFWRLLKWNEYSDGTNEWVFSSTLLDGMNPFATKAIAFIFTRWTYMGPPLSDPYHRDTWITGRNGFSNSGNAPGYSGSGVESQWNKDLGNGAIDAPVTAAAGKLFAITSGVIGSGGTYSTNAKLFCLSETGDTIWSAELGKGHHVAAPLIWNKVVYAPSADGNLYAFDMETGASKWTYNVGSAISSSPLMAQNLIIAAGSNGNVVAVDQNGARSWSTTIPTTIASTPAVRNGLVLIGGGDGSLYALGADGKGQQWKLAVGGIITGSPVALGDQIIVTYSDLSGSNPSGGGVAAISYEGAQQWKTSTDYTPGSAAVATDGIVAVSSKGLSMVGFTGALNWTTVLGSSTPGASPVAVTGMTYVVTNEQPSRLMAVDGNGSVAWTEDLADTLVASPSIANNMLYLPSSSGKLYAYLFTGLKQSMSPVGAFTFSVNERTASFDASTSYGGQGDLTFSWDFGDGQTAEGAMVEHTFSSGGNHTVVLTAIDVNGVSSNLTKTVNLDASSNTQPSPGGGGQNGNTGGGFPFWALGLTALALIVGINIYIRLIKKKK